ncbi:MAG: UDP-N-acetylmuramoyl-tripeptide--D-alanyl-D-alanine ligase [Bacteroidaceae bacterium]|nr:UDP-N-acetylmuramoyl-tripeptide--D-alanyl-D-alanine ligase [Bacteroidaceae bacterium]
MNILNIISIIFTLFVVACTVVTMRYDIQMFQLSSYRYSRYFRWWWPTNILTHRKWWPLAIMACLLNKWLAIVAAVIATASIYKELTEKYKTPIVFTMRVKRMYATALTLVALILTITAAVNVDYIPFAASITLLFSNFVVLAANIINTPIEKAITRHYYNDAKKIITSHKNLTIIGITGSFGKTSTKNYLARVLSEKYNVLVTPGNFNTLLGVVRTIREQLRPYHQVFIVEMGAKQPGDIKEICDLVHPQIGILTAVGEMHLETFKSFENIQKTKFELIDSLPADGLAVLNYDSQGISSYKERKSVCETLTYGVDNDVAKMNAQNIIYGGGGVSFTLDGEEYESKLLGRGNLLNILAAIAVANRLQVPANKQKAAISRLQPVEHRLSMRRANGITVLDDAYNSNPAGAAMAIEVLKNFSVGEGNKRIIITPGFVEMGQKQFEANKTLGTRIAQGCDYAIIVNETNREAIKSGLEEEKFDNGKTYFAANLNDAHAHLATILKAGDVVLYENDLPDNFK